MTDITIIYLTQNLLPEGWMKYQQKVLLDAVGDTPIISISRKPIDLGINLIQTEPSCPSNVYWQMLKAAKLATTKYIGVAEDDSLYCQDHFEYRPKDDEFAYNLSHWSIFSWDTSIFSWRNRKGNWTLICNREFLIKYLTERFEKYPNGTPDGLTGEPGRWRTDKQLAMNKYKAVDFYTNTPVINVCHEVGLDERARRHQKSFGTLRAHSIPYWGTPNDIMKNFK